MAILFSKYINIVSSVGGASVVPQRNLVARIFSDNILIPPETFIQFDNAAEVGAYFGTSSQEYLRAVFYFGWVSKNTTVPQFIQYARWVDTATAPLIFGISNPAYALSMFSSITNGSFGLTIGGVSHAFSSLDFSAAASLSDVAGVLQTAIRTETGTQWTAATVTYDASNARFNFVGGVTGAATITIQAGIGGTDVSGLIGWLPEAVNTNGVVGVGSIVCAGAAVETPVQALTNSVNLSNNFGSFTFMASITLPQLITIAEWNNTAPQDVTFLFTQAVSTANYATWAADVGGIGLIGGSSLTLNNINNQYAEMIPMMILAATDYNAINSVQNYEFQVFSLTPEVTDTTTSDALDALSVNYYGQTQSAGVFLSFYQQGLMMGLATDPLDMTTYANELWLKDSIGSTLMNLLLGLNQLAVNSTGRAQLLAALQAPINQAINNGTISVGKALTIEQQLFITQATGDPNAWQQVQTIGYWVNVTFTSSGSPLVYAANYTLIYSKDDVIRKVNGSDILI